MSRKYPHAGRPQDENIKSNVIQATLEIISEQGIEGVNIDVVAFKAKTTRPAIYRRWSKKEELIAEAIETQRPKFSVPDTGSLRKDLEQAVKDFLSNFGTQLGRQVMMDILSKSYKDDPGSKIWALKYGVPRVQDFKSIFIRAIERGEIDSEVDFETIMFILSAVLMQQCLLGDSGRELAHDKTIDDVVRFLLSCCCPQII
jgi:Transcriptional regulator